MDRTLAEKIYAQGKEATLLALLELAAENKVLLDQIEVHLFGSSGYRVASFIG